MLKKTNLKSSLSILLAAILLFTGVSCTSSSEYFENIETMDSYFSTEDFSLNINEENTITSATETTSDFTSDSISTSTKNNLNGSSAQQTISDIPAFSGNPYVVINNNKPSFTQAELTTTAYEKYSALDSLGRCGVAIASCGKEIMPKQNEERGSISSIKPSGWNQAKYDGISGGYLWNRCHLIGWQLSAENANRQNLITGTRYMNINGMLPFENMVADYIKETNNHVAYRVTPIYKGNNLVCSGVQLEAYSIEDNGKEVCFNVFCFNVQPDITINYADGSSYKNGSTPTTSTSKSTQPSTSTTTKQTTRTQAQTQEPQGSYVYITKTGKKYHSIPDCGNTKTAYKVTLAEAKSKTDGPCSKCW